MEKDPFRYSRSTQKLIANLRGIPENYKPENNWATEKGLDSIVDRLLKKYKIGEESIEDLIRENWPKIVGPANAPHCSPSRIERDTTLFIAVANPVIRQELQFNKSMILSNVRLLKGGNKIRNVVFKAG